MPVQVLTLDEKVGKSTERQVATDEVSFVSRSDRKVRGPTHFKQGDGSLSLQCRILNGQQLPALRFLVE